MNVILYLIVFEWIKVLLKKRSSCFSADYFWRFLWKRRAPQTTAPTKNTVTSPTGEALVTPVLGFATVPVLDVEEAAEEVTEEVADKDDPSEESEDVVELEGVGIVAARAVESA